MLGLKLTKIHHVSKKWNEQSFDNPHPALRCGMLCSILGIPVIGDQMQLSVAGQ